MRTHSNASQSSRRESVLRSLAFATAMATASALFMALNFADFPDGAFAYPPIGTLCFAATIVTSLKFIEAFSRAVDELSNSLLK